MEGTQTTPSIAVVIPCYNEAPTIAEVVHDFKKYLPTATIYVFDNNSTDQSAALARQASTQVVPSLQPGKGDVLRHMGAVVDADVYVVTEMTAQALTRVRHTAQAVPGPSR